METKMKVVIIDDEESAIDNLCFLLKKYEGCRSWSGPNRCRRSQAGSEGKTGAVVPGCGTSRYDGDGCGHPFEGNR